MKYFILLLILAGCNNSFDNRVEYWKKVSYGIDSTIVSRYIDTIKIGQGLMLDSGSFVSYSILDSLEELHLKQEEFQFGEFNIMKRAKKKFTFEESILNVSKFTICYYGCFDVLYSKGIGVFYKNYHHKGPKYFLERIENYSESGIEIFELDSFIGTILNDTLFFPNPPLPPTRPDM